MSRATIPNGRAAAKFATSLPPGEERLAAQGAAAAAGWADTILPIPNLEPSIGDWILISGSEI